MIVDLAARRRVLVEEILIEIQCRLLDLGHPDEAKMARRVCVLLNTPPERPDAGRIRLLKNAA